MVTLSGANAIAVLSRFSVLLVGLSAAFSFAQDPKLIHPAMLPTLSPKLIPVYTQALHWANTQAVKSVSPEKRAMPITAIVNAAPLTQDCQPLIFISLAMPRQSVQAWLQQAKKVQGVVLLRGLIHHSLRETLHTLAGLFSDNAVGVQIYPQLFRQFAIQHVPAVVMAAHASNISSPPAFDVIYGDVPLQTALTWLANEGGVCRLAAERLVQQGEKGV